VLGDTLIYLSLQSCQLHAASTVAHKCIEIELERVLFTLPDQIPVAH
jgi:hypothetical protein